MTDKQPSTSPQPSCPLPRPVTPPQLVEALRGAQEPAIVTPESRLREMRRQVETGADWQNTEGELALEIALCTIAERHLPSLVYEVTAYGSVAAGEQLLAELSALVTRWEDAVSKQRARVESAL